MIDTRNGDGDDGDHVVVCLDDAGDHVAVGDDDRTIAIADPYSRCYTYYSVISPKTIV